MHSLTEEVLKTPVEPSACRKLVFAKNKSKKLSRWREEDEEDEEEEEEEEEEEDEETKRWQVGVIYGGTRLMPVN